jgi:hypothetical protein
VRGTLVLAHGVNVNTYSRSWVLGVFSALSLFACVSDLSPGPYKSNPNELPKSDAGDVLKDGSAAVDSSVSPATGDPPVQTPDSSRSLGSDAGSVASPASPAGPCDLTGRWIMTERNLSSAFGARQVNQGWMYAELTQTGDDLVFTKSLLCGGSTDGLIFTVHMDDSKAWPGYQKFANYNGRKGSSKRNGSRCDVALETDALVRGMTPAVYEDQSVPLPTREQQAMGSTPGWEDWDQDGHPGVTMVVSGSAQGNIYTAFRTFATDTGSITASASTFILDDHQWVQERGVLAYEPPTAFLFTAPAERAPDKGANLVEFTRLSADQATGDDDAICQAIRDLAPLLTPHGTKIE